MSFPKWMRRAHGKKVGWACEVKGCKRGFKDENGAYLVEFHHILPTSSGGKDTFDNIMCVCLYHHAKLHEKLAKEGLGDSRSSGLIWHRYKKTCGGKTDRRLKREKG